MLTKKQLSIRVINPKEGDPLNNTWTLGLRPISLLLFISKLFKNLSWIYCKIDFVILIRSNWFVEFRNCCDRNRTQASSLEILKFETAQIPVIAVRQSLPLRLAHFSSTSVKAKTAFKSTLLFNITPQQKSSIWWESKIDG